VERPEEHLTVREAVIVVVDAAGGTVEGRTAVQKLCYFAGLALNEDLGHHAHFYGPYSRPVESALLNEAFAGDLEETVRTFSGWSGRDGKAYTYTMTEQGAELVADVRRTKRAACERVDEIVHKLGELVEDYEQRPLSLAAKVDLILRQRGTGARASEIPELARQLGWTVDDGEVDLAVGILTGLGRLEATPAA
jgi:uncharacterized protein YwgA